MKRLFDIIVSIILLAFFMPVLIILIVIVKFNMGSPVLFRQERPGLNGKIFEIVKFRTMKDAFDSKGDPLPDSERLTKFGKFLRSTSLDELPELWNVLKGEMSIVGPRPLLVEYLELYSEEQKKRHLVRPGITGLAQVSGRNAISWDEKFALDLSYVKNHSLKMDLIIILKTIYKVILRSEISGQGEVTYPKFTGSKEV
jgi:lipopolysaccharide/colanic/teichoic acid biosynthesis glycosyltransferase